MKYKIIETRQADHSMDWIDRRVWSLGSVLDFAAPIAACVAVYFLRELV
jgi:hypothetical protein